VSLKKQEDEEGKVETNVPLNPKLSWSYTDTHVHFLLPAFTGAVRIVYLLTI
jgi:hypothetical protein